MLRVSDWNNVCVIYGFQHIDSRRWYVGQTKNKGINRRQNHIRVAFRRKPSETSHLHNALVKYGIDAFTFEILEVCNSPEELNEREIYWINKLNALYPNGFNYREGGAGDTAEGISRGNFGKKKTPAWNLNLSQSRTGFKMSEAQKKKLSEIGKGRKQSEETKNKKSVKLKGRKTGPCTPERRLAIIAGMTEEGRQRSIAASKAAFTGKKKGPHKPETILKMQEAGRKRRHTDATKKKLSDIQKGKKRGPYSPEHIANARAGLIRYLESIGKRPKQDPDGSDC